MPRAATRTLDASSAGTRKRMAIKAPAAPAPIISSQNIDGPNGKAPLSVSAQDRHRSRPSDINGGASGRFPAEQPLVAIVMAAPAKLAGRAVFRLAAANLPTFSA